MAHEQLQPIKMDGYKPLGEVVFEYIRQAIISGIFAPGERLMEIQMAQELGVSRTPVREAIRRLEQEGLVVMQPRRGTYVANISITDINEVFEIRTALDILAAELAAERISQDELEQMRLVLAQIEAEAKKGENNEKLVAADIEFHDLLYKASRNKKLCELINSLREQTTVLRAHSIRYPGRIQETLAEHRAIVEALAQRNSVKAGRIIEAHLDNAERTLLHIIEEKHTGEDKK